MFSFYLSLFLWLRFVFPFFPCLNRLLNALGAKPQLLFALHNLLSRSKARQVQHVYEVRPRKTIAMLLRFVVLVAPPLR